MYIAGFWSKEEKEREFDIHYSILEKDSILFLECRVEGGKASVTVPLKTKSTEKAEQIAAFLAERSVHPYHIEDILSELCF